MDAFDRIAARTPQETKRFVSKMLDIADRIHDLLEARGMTQKDLAKVMGKSESEISKWLTGMHNLELKTIAKIEEVLGEDILAIPQPVQRQQETVTLHVHTPEHRMYGGPMLRPSRYAHPTEFKFSSEITPKGTVSVFVMSDNHIEKCFKAVPNPGNNEKVEMVVSQVVELMQCSNRRPKNGLKLVEIR